MTLLRAVQCDCLNNRQKFVYSSDGIMVVLISVLCSRLASSRLLETILSLLEEQVSVSRPKDSSSLECTSWSMDLLQHQKTDTY